MKYNSDKRLFLQKFSLQQQLALEEKGFIQILMKFIKDMSVPQGSFVLTAVPSFLNLKNIIELLSKNEKLSSLFYIKNIVTKVNTNCFFNNKNKNISNDTVALTTLGFS